MRRGYTLLEMVVVLGITLLIGGVLSSVLTRTWQTITTQADIRQSENSLQSGLQRIQDVVKQGKLVLDNYETLESSENTLIVSLPSIDSDQQTIGGAIDTVIYRLNPDDPTKLEEQIIPDPTSSRQAIDRSILTDIVDFSVVYYSQAGDILAAPYSASQRVAVAVTLDPGHSIQQITAEQQIALRNRHETP